MRTTNIKFTGMASGLDTEAIVDALIAPDKLKVDQSKQDKQKLDWRKELWKDMNNKLLKFYREQIEPMSKGTIFNKNTVSVSKEGYFTINNPNQVPTGSHDITITQIAKAARLNTQKITHTDNAGEELDVTTTTTLNEILGKGLDEVHSIDFKLNGKDVTLEGTDTLKDIEKKLQEADPNLSINFDDTNNAFFISNKETGGVKKEGKNDITLEADTSEAQEALKKLGIIDSNGKIDKVDGQDALVTYNGMEITSESNNISINGMNLTLKAESTTPVTITSQKDTEAIIKQVTSFVDSYNELITGLNALVGTKPNKEYAPLTEDQKKDMSADEIKMWEAKAKEGLFYRDPSIQKFLDTMRNNLGGTNEAGTFKVLADIGVTTGNYKENGKLHIDEDKLRAAIEKDADSVVGLFAGKDKKPGIMDKIYDTISEQLKSSSVNSFESFYNDKALDKSLSDKKTEIMNLEERMKRREAMYFKQFTAMEKAMSEINSQSAFFSSMLQ